MEKGKIVRSFINDYIDLFTNTKQPRYKLRKNSGGQLRHCYACGHSHEFVFKKIINDELAEKWGLNESLRKSFDIRESSQCTVCGSSLRSNLHARTICYLLAPETSFLVEAVRDKEFRKLKIAEINAYGALHKLITDLPNLMYSEYMSADKKTRRENLDKLSYPSSYFDVVLTSETLEHVPDWRLAKREIHRVLKPGGHHIFTVPAVLTRRTRTRAVMQGEKVKKILPASYHGYNRGKTEDYLVFNEFGSDFRKSIDELGFDTKIYYRNLLHLSDPNLVFVSTKL